LRKGLNYNIIGNVEHDEHIMIVQHNHLVGRLVGENMTNSSSGSPHATCVPGCIGMDLGISFVGTRSKHQGTCCGMIDASKEARN
jgi:hypothetical protein